MAAMATAAPEVPLRCESDMHLQRDLEILKSIPASFSTQKPHDSHRHPLADIPTLVDRVRYPNPPLPLDDAESVAKRASAPTTGRVRVINLKAPEAPICDPSSSSPHGANSKAVTGCLADEPGDAVPATLHLAGQTVSRQQSAGNSELRRLHSQ